MKYSHEFEIALDDGETLHECTIKYFKEEGKIYLDSEFKSLTSGEIYPLDICTQDYLAWELSA